jgi:hypothetical protein
MYGVVGVLLLCLGLLVARAGIAGARMTPVPAWLSDAMQGYLVVPFIVTAIVIGIGSLGTWLLGGYWQSETALGWGGMAAIIAAYVLASRAVRVWGQSRQAAVPLSVVEGGRPQDPSRPPQQPPLKKAA